MNKSRQKEGCMGQEKIWKIRRVNIVNLDPLSSNPVKSGRIFKPSGGSREIRTGEEEVDKIPRWSTRLCT